MLYTDNQLTQATHGSYRVADFVAAKTSYIQAHPKIIEAFVKALSQGAALYQGDPAKAASLSWKQDGAPDSSAALGLLKTSVYPTLSQQLTSAYLGKPGSPGELGSVIENVASFEKQLGTMSTTISLSQAQQLPRSRPRPCRPAVEGLPGRACGEQVRSWEPRTAPGPPPVPVGLQERFRRPGDHNDVDDDL